MENALYAFNGIEKKGKGPFFYPNFWVAHARHFWLEWYSLPQDLSEEHHSSDFIIVTTRKGLNFNFEQIYGNKLYYQFVNIIVIMHKAHKP